MKELNWNNIEQLSTEDISYMLFREGKDIKTISFIRNISKIEVEKHIIHSKIKYRIYKYGTDEKSILKALMNCPKDERISILSKLHLNQVKLLENFILNNIFNVNQKECTFYIWLLGEIKSEKGVNTIITFLKCRDAAIKRMCCSAIGKIGSIKGEDALILVLNDNRNQVKEYAIKALGNIKSKKSISHLQEIINNKEEKEYVKTAAIMAIEKINIGGEIC